MTDTSTHDAVVAGPDYLTETYYDVVLSGGCYVSSAPIENLADELLSQLAITMSAGVSATVADVDLGALRSISFVGVPDSNVSRQGRVQLIVSDTPAFSGLTAGAAIASGASTITVRAGNATTLHVGDIFSIAGDKDSTGKLRKYAVQNATTLASGQTCQIGIGTTAASSFASGVALTCHTGDFSTAVASNVYMGSYEDWWPVVYDVDSLSWPLKSWDGKLPDDEAQDFPKQWFHVFNTPVIGRYIRLNIQDTANTDGNVQLARLFASGGWYGDVYLELGATLGWDTTTTTTKSRSNAKFASVGAQYRRVVFKVPNVQVDKALQAAADMVKRVGTHRQVYMVIDKDDGANRHRVCFIGRLSRLDPQEFANFDSNNVPFSIEEDTEGEV